MPKKDPIIVFGVEVGWWLHNCDTGLNLAVLNSHVEGYAELDFSLLLGVMPYTLVI